jgi:hypothetical protein
MGSPERPLFDDESCKGEEIDPAHFYAAYIFDQPGTHDRDIAAIVSKAKEFGYPTRFWWLSDAMDLEESPDRLIVCVHHASLSADAGLDLYRALKEQQVSWTELEAAQAVEYLMAGRPFSGLEDLRTPDGKPLFPHENPAVIEWAQPHDGLAIRLEVADPVMEPIPPEEREKLSQVLGKAAVLFSAVLAHKEKLEQAGDSLAEPLDFIACHFELLTEVYTTDLSAIPLADQEYPFLELGQDTDYSSLAETEIDDVDALSETAFAAWMGRVDEIVFDMAGCSVHDLPDIDYRTFFETEATPFQAADAALLNAGFSRFE